MGNVAINKQDIIHGNIVSLYEFVIRNVMICHIFTIISDSLDTLKQTFLSGSFNHKYFLTFQGHFFFKTS